MKKRPVLRWVLIVYLVIGFFSYLKNTVSNNDQIRSVPSSNAAVSPAPRESLDDVLNHCAEKFINEYPDHSRAEYNPDTRRFLFYFWQDDIEDVVTQAISGVYPSDASWYDVCASVEELSLSIQREFDEAGYGAVSADVYLLNPDNTRLSLLRASRGVLLYDVVAAASIDSGYTSETLFATLGASDVAEARTVSQNPIVAPALADTAVHHYVLNTSSKKFHLPGCSSVDGMSFKNRDDVTDTRQAVIAMGYQPCGRCNP